MDEAITTIEFLARSPGRVHLIQLLRERGPLRQHELREMDNTSRTTLQRNLDALEEQGWVHRTDREYSLTLVGATITTPFSTLVETVEIVDRLTPVFKWISDDELDLDFDLSCLADATVVAPTDAEPYAPVNLHIEALKRATSVELLLPVMGLDALEVGQQRMAEENVDHQVIVTAEIATALRSNATYRDRIEEALQSGSATILVYEGSIPYYLGLFDDVVQLGAVDQGVPQGMLETANADVRAWAERTFAEFKEAALPFALTAK